ncbi:HalOD1 output domain-containing protein [Halosolutus amylolyticus]|uniref:HalOD1 output domain-containing protein n=1 Tax=Halosolutus amylolyticus TaxID=2932267 RepID=A0ABD5PUW2_9EURY|nr:HalOD1 output domain-containing protein [Halosolutus amylolyticus]
MTSDEGGHRDYADGDERLWDRATTGPPSHTVITAVARLEGCNPMDLPPLYDAIDPEAIDALFPDEPNCGADRVSFRYCGYEIDVRPSVVRIRDGD